MPATVILALVVAVYPKMSVAVTDTVYVPGPGNLSIRVPFAGVDEPVSLVYVKEAIALSPVALALALASNAA